MKNYRILLSLLILAAISAVLPADKAQAGSRVYVGLDLGGVIAAFDSRPHYVYTPPVVYERWHAWRLAPPPPCAYYPPPRWRHHPPPPPPYYDRHRERHHRDRDWNGYRR
ncbi:MAG: hypothetical protein PHI97_23500 [Desulfobulbus sp.]|nr:hypothetical protein [Desulfobulbus sp.]